MRKTLIAALVLVILVIGPTAYVQGQHSADAGSPTPHVQNEKTTKVFGDFIHTYTINGVDCISVSAGSNNGIGVSCNWPDATKAVEK